jgi:phenylalanyl-tRNA synthetase beta chain
VRYATKGEKLTLLDGKTVELRDNELVVADNSGAVSLAGVMGGLGTEVSDQTTDVLLEAATWDPVTVRRAARRLGIRTDSSYRFERVVDPRTIDRAARRAASLILQVGGPTAQLVPGVLAEGTPVQPPLRVSMRVQRCRDIIGLPQLPVAEMTRVLRGHEIQVVHEAAVGATAPGSPSAIPPAESGVLDCLIPSHRPDLDREIDLIEEVARTYGLQRVPIQEKIPVRVAEPQVSERAMRELTGVLTGLGFFETVTFSFVSPKQAEPFIPTGLAAINLCDERRKADPTLRPSIIPSLLACRKANQDGNVHAGGGVRLFEITSVFSQVPPVKGALESKDHTPARGKEVETRMLAMIADAASLSPGSSEKAIDLKQNAFRLVRGAIESIVRTLGGASVSLELVPLATVVPGFDHAACADVRLITGGNTQRIGTIALIHPNVQRQYDLQAPVVAAEIHLTPLLALFPPRTLVHELPQFPGIERDISLIVGEQTPWASVDRLVSEAKLDRLVGHEFVTTFRGTQVGQGKKSVTLRLAFRDPARTLRHEEVDPQVGALVKLAQDKLGATIRA